MICFVVKPMLMPNNVEIVPRLDPSQQLGSRLSLDMQDL